jgi:hypothetical protein
VRRPSGLDIVNMIIDMNTRAKEQNGRLVDLALPEELYEILTDYLNSKDAGLVYDLETHRLLVDGVQIHIGEAD